MKPEAWREGRWIFLMVPSAPYSESPKAFVMLTEQEARELGEDLRTL